MSVLDAIGAVERLAATRPIFHSEADFQHALAWQIQLEHPTARIRLETRPTRGVHLDLLVDLEGRRVAVELKYLVARFEGVVAGELFDLPNHGAHDISRHDVVKDVVRVERFVAAEVADEGWVVALTNDPGYWRPGTKRDPVDEMFRLHEGAQLRGTLRWSALAGTGTTRGRDEPLILEDVYSCGWRDYSEVTSSAGRTVAFKYLAFEVSRR